MSECVKHAVHNFLTIEVNFEIPISQILLWLWNICRIFSCSLAQRVEQKIHPNLSLNTSHNRFLAPYESILEECTLYLSNTKCLLVMTLSNQMVITWLLMNKHVTVQFLNITTWYHQKIVVWTLIFYLFICGKIYVSTHFILFYFLNISIIGKNILWFDR